MKRIIAATVFAAATIVSSATASNASVLTNQERAELSSGSSASVFGMHQSTSRNINSGLSIGLCSDGSVDIAGLASEPGVYGVSLNIFGDIAPMMTAKPFYEGEMVNVKSFRNIYPVAGLPVTLVASKAPIGAYDDSVRAEFSNTVLLTVPMSGCHYNNVTF